MQPFFLLYVTLFGFLAEATETIQERSPIPAPLRYDVSFSGLHNAQALHSLQNASRLISLQDRPPASINGLRYRITEDIPNLLRVLHAYAYYDAEIIYDIERTDHTFHVLIYIEPGIQYALTSYQIFRGDECTQPFSLVSCGPFCPSALDLEMGQPALSQDIVNAELCLLTQLSRCGYPLAYINRRKVEVDLLQRSVHAAVCIQEGPLSRFGPVMLFGLKEVEPRYIARKLAWKEGDIFDSDLLEKTQERLLKSDLFTSVFISHSEQLDASGALALKMRLTESRHHTFSLGAYYATVDGPGIEGGWTHRNVRGMGEVVSIEGEGSLRYVAGSLSFKKPDFLRFDQSYTAIASLSRENIHPYLAFSYGFSNFIERIVHEIQTYSWGFHIEHITVSQSAENGTYLLVGLPLLAKISTTDSPLNPTRGFTLVYQATPYQSLMGSEARFVKQRLTSSFYFPFDTNQKIVLALRTQWGSIAGARRELIPLPKLFLGGSEDELRGYRYKTVSPLNDNREPLGGRSAIYATTELRFRITSSIGFVPFADFGCVTNTELPTVNTKWFKSLGAGLRYFAFFGPLRLDIGFPLDRRKGIDPPFRIYASVGQAF